MSAHGRSCDVLAGRFHLGKGKASDGLSAEGMLMRECGLQAWNGRRVVVNGVSDGN